MKETPNPSTWFNPITYDSLRGLELVLNPLFVKEDNEALIVMLLYPTMSSCFRSNMLVSLRRSGQTKLLEIGGEPEVL